MLSVCALYRNFQVAMRCRLRLGRRLHAITTFFRRLTRPSNRFSRILPPRKDVCLSVMCLITSVHACLCAFRTNISQFILTDHGILGSQAKRSHRRIKYVGPLLSFGNLEKDNISDFLSQVYSLLGQ